MIAVEGGPPQLPSAPADLAGCGLSVDLLLQLLLKALHLGGTLSGVELTERLGVPFAALQQPLDQLKGQQHCEIVGGSPVGGPGFRYRITDAGHHRAALFLEKNHYAGVAPVPLEQYCRYMRAFAAGVANPVSPERLRATLRHLVLDDRVLRKIGPSVRAGRSLFIYGPPGNGKTVISRALHDLLDGEIAIPHALEVEGSIVRVYDPVNHKAIPDSSGDADTGRLDRGPTFDRRWVRCRRPFVMVGGEFNLDSLSLSYSPATGFYRAPVQITANGGLLLIDDFGRQQCSPRDLLNRWISPLEAGTVFLTLQTGQTFEVPFSTLVVFATNIRPSELVEEAFMRRLQYKIFAPNPTAEAFVRIFENYCHDVEVPFDREPVEALLREYFQPRRIPLRGCQPRDIVNHALAIADYGGAERRLTFDLLVEACESYFVDAAPEGADYV